MIKKFKDRLVCYGIPDPFLLFADCEKSIISYSKEVFFATLYIENCRERYFEYAKKLSDAGFILRASTDHVAIFFNTKIICLLEYNESGGFLRVSLIKGARQQRIWIESDLELVLKSDYAKNREWVQTNHLSPHYVFLKYSDIDFRKKIFKRVLVRFADFIRCNFSGSRWVASRFCLCTDGGYLYCIFKNCDFSGSEFVGCNFSYCRFIACDLTGAKFRNCNFSGALMQECLLEDFNMIRCKTKHFYFIHGAGGGDVECE